MTYKPNNATEAMHKNRAMAVGMIYVGMGAICGVSCGFVALGGLPGPMLVGTLAGIMVGAICALPAMLLLRKKRFSERYFIHGGVLTWLTAVAAGLVQWPSVYWIPAVPAATLLIWSIVAGLTLPQASYLDGHCRRCGYDLRGNVSGRCPECGLAFVRSRCRKCGYLLRGNVSGQCPECGTPTGGVSLAERSAAVLSQGWDAAAAADPVRRAPEDEDDL